MDGGATSYNRRMTETDRRPIDYIAVTRETYAQLGYQPYRWALNEDPPSWATLGKPLSEARLGLIASGGIYRHGQVAFTHRDDVTHREIPTDVDSAEVRVTHFAFDPAAARRDPNVVFPIDTLRSSGCRGHCGGVGAPGAHLHGRHLLAAPAGLRTDLGIGGPRTLEMELDAVLLVPV